MALNQLNQTARLNIDARLFQNVKALFRDDPDTDGLQGVRWNTGGVGPQEQSIPGIVVHWYADPSWAPEVVSEFRDALNTWSNVASITFRQVNNPDNAEIVFRDEKLRFEGGVSGAPAEAELATRHDSEISDGGKVIAVPGQVNTYLSVDPTTPVGKEILVHELGHALGLKHPHDTKTDQEMTFVGVTDGVQKDTGAHDQNLTVYSIMSYNKVAFGEASNKHYAAAPMAYDIAAIQVLYGTKLNVASGNNTYRLQPDDTTWVSIWDAGGNDTVSYQGGSMRAVIDLRPATLDSGEGGGGYLSYVYDKIVNGMQVKKGGFTIAGDVTNALADVGGTRGVIIENAVGGNNDDDITGNDAANILRGGRGRDSISGGGGVDQLFGDEDDDSLRGGSGDDIIYGGIGNDRLFGEGDNDRLIGGDGNDTIEGGSGDDVIHGEEGNDILKGGLDHDTLKGGSGNDDLNGNGGKDLLYGGIGDDILDGGADKDTLYGGDGNDELRSSRGDDFMNGNGGVDTLSYLLETKNVNVDLAAGKATIQRSASELDTDTLVSIENVISGLGNDTIRGNGADNTFAYHGRFTREEKYGGFDTYIGGSGHDTVDFTHFSTGHLNVDLAAGIATGSWRFIDPAGGQSGGTGQIAKVVGFESVIASFGDDTVLGNVADNTFTYVGSFTKDSNNGGHDTYNGGEGFDTLDLSRLEAGKVFVNLEEGRASATYSFSTPTGGGGGGRVFATLSSIEIVSGTSGDDHIIGNGDNNTLRGKGGDDHLVGGDGDDLLDGGNGADTLDGGRGDDYFVVAGDVSATGLDIIKGGEGMDTINFASLVGSVRIDLDLGFMNLASADGFSFIAGSPRVTSVENVIGSAYDDTLLGNADANVLLGGGGDDELAGGAGNDTLDGGDNLDTAVFAGLRSHYTFLTNADDTTVTNVLTGETDTIRNIETLRFADMTASLADLLMSTPPIVGSSAADVIEGTAQGDIILGREGNDFIINNGGADIVDGGDGDDIIVTDNFDVDIIYGGAGYDQVYASSLTIPGGFNFTLTPEISIEGVSGHHGDDRLDASAMTKGVYMVGMLGNDVMIGGSGEDIMIGDAYFNSPAGNDIMYGGAGSDQMSGYNGDDIMYAGGSNPAAGYGDRLMGGTGNDELHGGGFAWLFGEEGDDVIYGGGDLDWLVGGEGNDTLIGSAGAETLYGGTGMDKMTGGGGADRFDFIDGWGKDTITDFNFDEGDRIGMYGVAGLDSFDQLMIVASSDGTDVSFGDNTLQLSGISPDQLHTGWFGF